MDGMTVGQFKSWITENDIGDDTMIVVKGDHCEYGEFRYVENTMLATYDGDSGFVLDQVFAEEDMIYECENVVAIEGY